MKILAVVPARGGSKGIPRKNIALLAGHPLIAYTLAAAQAARSLDRIVVSTDDTEISGVCSNLGAEVLIRPAYLSGDQATTRSLLLHVVQTLAATGYQPDAVMTLQPTSPLRTSIHIDTAAALFANDLSADSLVSCLPVPHIFHPHSVMRRRPDGYLASFLNEPQPTRRQDKELVFARNGAAIYLTRTECLSEFVFGGRLLPYLMDDVASLDIDTHKDLILAESYILNGNG